MKYWLANARNLAERFIVATCLVSCCASPGVAQQNADSGPAKNAAPRLWQQIGTAEIGTPNPERHSRPAIHLAFPARPGIRNEGKVTPSNSPITHALWSWPQPTRSLERARVALQAVPVPANRKIPRESHSANGANKVQKDQVHGPAAQRAVVHASAEQAEGEENGRKLPPLIASFVGRRPTENARNSDASIPEPRVKIEHVKIQHAKRQQAGTQNARTLNAGARQASTSELPQATQLVQTQVIALETSFQETRQSQVQSPKKDSKLLNAADMTGELKNPIQLFERLEVSDEFLSSSQVIATGARQDANSVSWFPSEYTWSSPAFYHKPLYFEQPNLERYGIGRSRLVQPVASGFHFFASIALIPYKSFTHHPAEKVYTLGHNRPGDRVPVQRRVWLGQSTFGEVRWFWADRSGYR